MKKQSNKYVLYLQETREFAGDFKILCKDFFVLDNATKKISDLFSPGMKISVVDPNGGVLVANYMVFATRYRARSNGKKELEVSIMDPRVGR